MIKSKSLLGVALACCVCTNVAAQEFSRQVWINPGLFSYHFDRDQGYREKNWGLGAEVLLARNHALMAGTFINSERERSRYFGYQWRPLHWQPRGVDVSAGVGFVAVDGYPGTNDKDWFIAPLPMVAVEYQRVGANFIFIPHRKSAAVAVQFKLRVW